MVRAMRAGIVCVALAAIFSTPGEVAAQVPVTVLHAFDALTAPRSPYSPLIQASDGNFYGTTASGGTDGAGTVYKMTPSGTVTVLHSFNRSTEGSTPFAGLLQASDGNFYGSVSRGPDYSDGGRLFRMTAQGAVTIIAPFAASALVETPNGALYGVTPPSPSYAGSVFRWQAGTYTTLHDFMSSPSSPEGYGPSTLMLGADGKFYGTTAYGGTGGAIFRISGNGFFETLHSFTGGAEGAFPSGPLVQTPDGAIFGTSSGGGAENAGTVFRMGPDLTVTVIHSFEFSGGSPSGLIAGSDGAFYGTTGYRAMLYRITATGEFTPISTDPALLNYWPSDPVLGQDGHFYLTNAWTGLAGAGSIGRVTAGGSTTVLYEFSGSSEGTNPIAPLLQAPDGNFYGTTPRGGPAERGAVFVVSPTGQFTTPHTFSGPDGATPSGALVRTSDGRFYGMTSYGGSFDRGTVYGMEPSGEVTVLHSFAGGEDGSYPVGALLQAADGNLYGATSNGGSSDRGTAFRITLAGSLTILHAFAGVDDGTYPASGLFQGTDGNFYGVTLSSADSYYGTAYRMTAAGTVTVLHRLYRHDGDYSYVGVNPIMQASDGNIYGTTQGRKGVRGTFFRIDPAGNVTMLREFAQDTESPSNGLIQATDGNLYGIFGGAIARLTLSGELTTIRTLDYRAEGTQPNQLLQAADGNFYTTTWDGGLLWGGTVLRITVVPSPPTRIAVATRRDNTIRLTWPQGAPGTSYLVKRGGTSGGETLLASGITTNTFSDPTAVRGRRYYYVVTAINAFGESVASYEVSMTAGQAVAGDFDGDSAADITVFRPGSGEWFVLESETTYSTARVHQWGLPGDLPALGDFDGDGLADPAIYRPLTGTWWVLKSSSDFTQSFSIQWGLTGDAPVPADYDGDGRSDVAVYRPSTGEWYIRWSGTDYATASTYQWGLPGDFPVPGDYDGDGLTDLAVYRPSNGVWYVRSSSSDYTAMSSYQWGLPGDVAVPGDYDGDGRTDFAIYRPSTGHWYVRQSSTNYTTYARRQWGLPGDTPVPADYDGDGITDFAVFRPGGGVWYVMDSVAVAWESHQWGLAGDVPLNRR